MSEHVPGDSIDRVLAGWAKARPDLDVEPIAVAARIARLSSVLRHELDAVFARYGLTAPGFAVLATLVRLGTQAPVAQRRLMEELNLSSGTVSVRVDRLAEDGLVRREPDPQDRRGSLVALSAEGLEAFDACAPEHLANERRLLAGLGRREQETLTALLRKLLSGLEGQAAGEEVLRLGLTLSPAHVAAEMRRAVGLPELPGLLVREVHDGEPAARAGVERGDLLIRAGRRELRSLADLHAAVASAGATLGIAVVRGAEERRATLWL